MKPPSPTYNSGWLTGASWVKLDRAGMLALPNKSSCCNSP